MVGRKKNRGGRGQIPVNAAEVIRREKAAALAFEANRFAPGTKSSEGDRREFRMVGTGIAGTRYHLSAFYT